MIIKISQEEAAAIVEEHLSSHFKILPDQSEKEIGTRVWTEEEQDGSLSFNVHAVLKP